MNDSLNDTDNADSSKKDLEYLIPKLQNTANMLGDKLDSALFLTESEVILESFYTKSKELLLISDREATKLWKYLFDIYPDEEELDMFYEAKTDSVQFKLYSLVGEYSKCSDDIIDSIIHEFISLFKSSKSCYNS